MIKTPPRRWCWEEPKVSRHFRVSWFVVRDSEFVVRHSECLCHRSSVRESWSPGTPNRPTTHDPRITTHEPRPTISGHDRACRGTEHRCDLLTPLHRPLRREIGKPRPSCLTQP